MQNPNPSPKPNNIALEIPADLQAIYSNLALISHLNLEFFLDFAQVMPGQTKARVHSRVVMSPVHVKLLYRALGENIARYEQNFGEIGLPPTLADQLFSSLRPNESPNADPETNDDPQPDDA